MNKASLEQEKAQAEKKLRQLQNHQKILQNRISDAERRARTHMLIEHGAVLENVFPQIVPMSGEEVKKFLQIRTFLLCLQKYPSRHPCSNDSWKRKFQ